MVNVFHIGDRGFDIFKIDQFVKASDPRLILASQTYIREAIIPDLKTRTRNSTSSRFEHEKFQNGVDILVGCWSNFGVGESLQIEKIIEDMTSLDDLTDSNYLHHFNNIFKKNISETFTNAASTELLGILLSPGGLWTTTYDYNRRGFLGLHVDNWDGLETGRSKGRYRIICNIGAPPRHFIYNNRSVDNLVGPQRTKSATEKIQTMQRSELGETFTIGLGFGQFCIVPTENLIHDGSTREANKPSIALTGLARLDEVTLRTLS